MSILRWSYHLFGAVAFILIASDVLGLIDLPTWCVLSLSLFLVIALGIFSYLEGKSAWS